MAKSTGFMEYPREDMLRLPVSQRLKNFKEFDRVQTNTRVKTQAARCMDCGVPFCNWGCPVFNLIPDFNNLVYEARWAEAYQVLSSTNNFPEFTGRICPAPCEPACTLSIIDNPVSIKHVELAIVENAFKYGVVKPKKITNRSAYKIAVIGSGPAGLAAADQLNVAGHNVTVFEKEQRFGGLLTYGIPDFKLEKWVVERRLQIMRQEGIKFINNFHLHTRQEINKLLKKFDIIALCIGAPHQKDAGLKNSHLQGVHKAMDFLINQNKLLASEKNNPICAADKHVVVLGGGDTGADCVGTANRLGAKSVTQLQLHKKPPLERYSTNPWPHWPAIYKDSSSHEEGCERLFSHQTCQIIGESCIQALQLEEVIWPEGQIASGKRNFKFTGNKKTIPCDLLLISLGFEKTANNPLTKLLQLKTDVVGNVAVDNFQTSHSRIFAAGDFIEGANLVVTAISSGRQMAKAIHNSITA